MSPALLPGRARNAIEFAGKDQQLLAASRQRRSPSAKEIKLTLMNSYSLSSQMS